MLAEAFLRSGKVRDLSHARRRAAAARRLRPDQRLRRRAAAEIPDKGRVLTGLSRFWFAETAGIVPEPPARHGPDGLRGLRRGRPPSRGIRAGRRRPARRTARPDDDLPAGRRRADRGGRPRLPRRLRLEGVPGNRHGLRHPAAPGLRESDRLPEPIFTPATKAEHGEHDENIDFDRMIEHIETEVARRARARRPAG